MTSSDVYLYCTGAVTPDDSLWRERLANQGVRIVHIPETISGIDLSVLASELTQLFPEHEKTIADNLYRELQRRQPSRTMVDLALIGSD